MTDTREQSYLDRLTKLYTPVVCDALDALGYRDRSMDPALAPLAGPPSIAGRAATIQVIAVDKAPDQPYHVQFEAVDALRPSEIMVVSAPEVRCAFWGELITTRAMENGCVGTVVDGYCRDLPKIRTRPFGVWARGSHPADSLGRLDAISWNAPISCGGVRVAPGDYLLCDVDGVVVVPHEVITETLDLADAKQRTEDEVRTTLRSGLTIANTYDRYGVM
jgi:regulator of RNase E activity RraA